MCLMLLSAFFGPKLVFRFWMLAEELKSQQQPARWGSAHRTQWVHDFWTVRHAAIQFACDSEFGSGSIGMIRNPPDSENRWSFRSASARFVINDSATSLLL